MDIGSREGLHRDSSFQGMEGISPGMEGTSQGMEGTSPVVSEGQGPQTHAFDTHVRGQSLPWACEIGIDELTLCKRKGGYSLKRKIKVDTRVLDVSHLPRFCFPIPAEYKKRTAIYTLPYCDVYPLILKEVHRLAQQSECVFTGLNFMLGMATKSIEDSQFGSEYYVLIHPLDRIHFKLEGGRNRRGGRSVRKVWKAIVGFPGVCYQHESQSLNAQGRLYEILLREGVLAKLYSGDLSYNFLDAVNDSRIVSNHPLILTTEEIQRQRYICSASNQDEVHETEVSARANRIEEKEYLTRRTCQSLAAIWPYGTQLSYEPIILGHHVGKNEYDHLNVYMQYVRSHTAVISVSIIMDGLNAASEAPLRSSNPVSLATQGSLWACVACGAAVRRHPDAKTYLHIAIEFVKDFFDVACLETFFAFSAIAYASHLLEPESFHRYFGFALVICEEIAESCTVEESLDCCMAMELLRGHIKNDASAEESSLYENADGRISILDDTVWKDAREHSTHSIKCGMRLWAQMAATLAEASKPGNQRPESLPQLIQICNEQRPHENFVVEFLLYANWMFIYVCSRRWEDAKVQAMSLIWTFEKYPILLALIPQPEATHMLLDAAAQLLDDLSLTRRIAVLKRALPKARQSQGGASLLQAFFAFIMDKVAAEFSSTMENGLPFTEEGLASELWELQENFIQEVRRTSTTWTQRGNS